MSKAPQNNLGAAIVVAGVLVVVLAIANPAMLGLVVPVALVLLGLYAKKRQDQQDQGQKAVGQTASPALRQGQQTQQPQQAQPQAQAGQQAQPVWAQPSHPSTHQAPPPPWWASQAFPQAEPPVQAPPPPPPTPVDPDDITVPPDLHSRVEVLRKTGKTVEAIDLLREETGMELYPASRYVLAIEAP